MEDKTSMEESQHTQKVKILKLIDYASEGKLIHVKKLLKENCDINVVDYFNFTPLHRAIMGQHKEVIELLLKNGADPNIHDININSPLSTATSIGNKEIVEMLLRYGARVNVKNVHGNTELHIAASKHYVEITKLLLEHGSDITIENCGSVTPIHVAISSGAFEIVKTILPYIDDINRRFFGQTTFLHYCVWPNGVDKTNVLEFFLKNGANPLLTDVCNETPLESALEHARSGTKFYDKYVLLLEKHEKIEIEKKMLLCFAHELDKESLLHKYFIGNGVFSMMMAYFG